MKRFAVDRETGCWPPLRSPRRPAPSYRELAELRARRAPGVEFEPVPPDLPRGTARDALLGLAVLAAVILFALVRCAAG